MRKKEDREENEEGIRKWLLFPWKPETYSKVC
jgi:hypothetical protein